MESVCSFFFNWLDYRSYRNLVWLWIERHRYGSRYGGSQCCRLCCSSLSTKWWCRSLRPWNINCPRQQCGRFGKRKKTNAMNLPKMQLARIDSQNGVLIRAISLDDEVMSQHQTDHHQWFIPVIGPRSKTKRSKQRMDNWPDCRSSQEDCRRRGRFRAFSYFYYAERIWIAKWRRWSSWSSLSCW